MSSIEQLERRCRKIAVVGGGLGGIVVTVNLKEVGLEPVCFEKTDRIGGTWCYREKSEIGVGSTMPTTIINHSKELGAISNFPPRKEFNNYMRHTELFQYVMEYATAKDALRHFKVNSEVVSVKRASDYDQSGRWDVTVRDTETGIEKSDVFDAVALCTGHMNRPKMPHYEGQEIFKGRILHTHGLKEVSEFKGQNVVVVGMGCSGLDAAVEISSVARQVYLSTRSGAHVVSRVGLAGFPIDYKVLTRSYAMLLEFLPVKWLAWYLRKLYIDPIFDYNLYYVEPQYHVLAKDPVINDQIGSKLLSGSVVQKKHIVKFTERGVIFDSDKEETQVDAVIMATGYDWKFPFLEKGIIAEEGERIDLFKCVFPAKLPHPTLAAIGFFLPNGPGFPPGELQCRWVASVFAGEVKLPSREVMMEEITKRHNYNLSRYVSGDKISLRVDYVQYMDSVAEELGVRPNLTKMFFTDLKLFWKLFNGPCVSYQYRLGGPYKWEGARDAIMTVDERLLYPLKRNNSHPKKQLHFGKNLFYMLLFIFITYFSISWYET